MNNQTKPKSDDRFQRTNSIVLNNDKFLIAVGGQDFDSVAAGAGLALLLESIGKEVDLYSPNEISGGNYQSLNGLKKFVNKLEGGDKRLEIVFNCPFDAIERVSSNEEGERLSLSVNFKEDAQEISPADVEIKRPDPAYPAGFILDANLSNEISLTSQGQWVWLSRGGGKKSWADVNVVESKATLSESLIALVSRGDFQIPVKAAENFYLGIKQGTNNFESADSIALETAAYCLRIKEKQQGKPAGSQPKAQKPVASQPASQEDAPSVEEVESKEAASPEGKEGKSMSEWKKPPIFTGATTPKK